MTDSLKKEFFYLKIAFILAVVTGLFFFWFYYLDVKYNPVITFPDHIDPQNFQLTKDEYKRGEMVQGITAFCKERESSGATEWTLHNTRLVFFARNQFRTIPQGCYPQESEFIIFDIHRVPMDAEIGEPHFFSAKNYQKLWGGRERVSSFKTEEFIVVE